MPISASTLELLIRAGLNGDALVDVVRSIDADMENAKPLPKEQSAGARRQAEYRARKAAIITSDITSDGQSDITSDATLSSSPPPKNNNQTPISSPSSLRSELSSARAEEIFETEFWPAYPKRDGSNPKQPAKTKFVAHVRSGIDPAEIVAGAKAYSIFMANDDPKFVMQTTKFLNQRCWQDDYSVRAQGPPKPRQQTWEDTADWFLRGEDDDGSRREKSPHEVVELSREDWTRA